MRIVYIAGKFRGPNTWEVHKNVQEALKVGFDVANFGAMPLIPHSNTHEFDGTLHDQFWLQGTLELLHRCDAVMTVLNWVNSTGARAEVTEATRLGIPVFHDLTKLSSWLGKETVHVCVFDNDADVPSIMMCGFMIEHDEGGDIVQVGHNFYGFESMLPGGPGYSDAKISNVTCDRCRTCLAKVLKRKG